jgi:hypothetical protein
LHTGGAYREAASQGFENWTVRSEWDLWVLLDRDDPDKSHTDLLKGVADVNRAVVVADPTRGGFVGDTYLDEPVDLDTVTTEELQLLEWVHVRIPIVMTTRNKHGDMKTIE